MGRSTHANLALSLGVGTPVAEKRETNSNAASPRAPPRLSGTATPLAPRDPSPIEKALESSVGSPSQNKCLEGFELLSPQTPACLQSEEAIIRSNNDTATNEARKDRHDGSSTNRRRFNPSISSAEGASKGNSNPRVKLPRDKQSPTPREDVPIRFSRAETRHCVSIPRLFQVRRDPAQRALLVTANSSPFNDVELDYTENDSVRFEECLKNLGYGTENIKIIKSVGKAFLALESVLQGIRWLLFDAIDGDLLVLFLSMHAGPHPDDQSLCLGFEDKHGSRRSLKPADLIYFINNWLPPRCTLEMVLDTCHATGLIKCRYLIRQTKNSNLTTALATPNEAGTSSPAAAASPTSPEMEMKTETGDYDTAQPLSRPAEPQGHPPITDTSRHRTHNVAVGFPIATTPAAESECPLDTKRTRSRKQNIFIQGAPPLPPPELDPKLNVIVWAAAELGQKAYECSSAANGVLVKGICKAIETGGRMKRWAVFDHVSAACDGFPQNPQLLTSHADVDNVSEEYAFCKALKYNRPSGGHANKEVESHISRNPFTLDKIC